MLSDEEADNGAVSIDIQKNKTIISYTFDNQLIGYDTVKVGTYNFSNDISQVKSISLEEAEMVRKQIDTMNSQRIYEKKLETYKNKNLNILEIGSYAGASAAAFTKYLPKSKVYCFDVNISNFKYKSENIKVFGIDINNQKKVVKTLNKIFSEQNFTQFDLIIDDGSHNLSDILISLKFFFKYVKNKGLYIIEDYKYPNYYKYNRNIDHLLVDQIFESLNNKKLFNSNIFNDDDQKELMNSIKLIETFKGNLNDSDISFITKA